MTTVSRGRDGVGHAIGEAYRREGAHVVLQEAETVDERRAAEDVLDAAVERFGRLDVVVLVAATGASTARIADMQDDQWTAAVDATLNDAFWGIRRALQHMIPRRQGRVIVVSSVAAKMATPGRAASAAGEARDRRPCEVGGPRGRTLGIKVNAVMHGVLEDENPDDLAAAFVEAFGDQAAEPDGGGGRRGRAARVPVSYERDRMRISRRRRDDALLTHVTTIAAPRDSGSHRLPPGQPGDLPVRVVSRR